MGAGVHHHAELREQQRERQHMHEPTAMTSNQKASAGEYSRNPRYRQARPVESCTPNGALLTKENIFTDAAASAALRVAVGLNESRA